MASSPSVEWTLSRGSSLVWKSWDDEYVVFNHGSGDTHLLDGLTGEVLRMLERVHLDAARLASTLATYFELEMGDELQQRIEHSLEQLHNVDLIEPLET